MLIKCAEIGHGRRRMTYSDTWNIAVQEAEREYVRSWRLTSDLATATAHDLLAQAQVAVGAGNPGPDRVPDQWDAYPTDVKCLAGPFSMTETECPEVWVAETTYKLYPDPATEPGVWQRSTGQNEVALEFAFDGAGNATVAIVNSAGDPFDPPPTRPEPYLILSCSQNRLTINEPDIVANYLHRVNSRPFRTFPAGQVYLADFGASPEYRNGTPFYSTKWTFWCRARGWQLRVLDCGYRAWPGVPFPAATRLSIRDQSGQPVQSPALLDGGGRKLVQGGAPVFLPFNCCLAADFNQLQLTGR